MKKCLFAGLLFILLMPGLSHAQADTLSVYNNSLKINTLSMVLRSVSLLYERSLNEHWSVQAGAGYRWGGDIPKAFALGNIVVDAQSKGIRGYSFTPELRYYFNLCDCDGASTGLYAGLYGRFTRYHGDLSIHAWTGSEYVDVISAGNLREYGLGLQLGYQFTIRKRFVVDLMFAGPRMSSNKISFSLDSDYVEELIPIIEDEINEKLEWLGLDPISIEPSTEMEAKFGFQYFRYAIGFGYRF